MSTQGVLEGNKITSNKITSNRLELNKITSNKITSNKITSNSYKITSNQLVNTAEGRELLSYVVECAIPQGIDLIATHQGVQYTFPGEIGLAPRWIDRSLREGEQRWVSACLLSRVNRYGISVAISIRGPHESLVVTESEANDFKREEGAFYGNIFTPINEPLVWFACRGRDEAVRESGSLDLRDCTERDPANPTKTLCGFDYVGDCADFTAPRSSYACKKFREPEDHDHDHGDDCRHGQGGGGGHDHDEEYNGGYYEECHDEVGPGRWPHAERFTEVVTVFVEP